MPIKSAGAVDQRAAGVARIDRRIGLDDVLDHAAAFVVDRAVQRRDHAGSQRMVETERIADRIDVLADAQVAARANRQRRRAVYRRLDVQHREVVLRTCADELCRVAALIGERDQRLLRTLDDVIVRHDVAAVVPNKAGARALRHPHHVAAPKIAHVLDGRDVHDRGTAALEDANRRELVRRQRAAGRRGAGLGRGGGFTPRLRRCVVRGEREGGREQGSQ